MPFLQKITLLNKTILNSLNGTDEQKIISAFTKLGIRILGASFGFVWFNSYASSKLELVYESPNLPYTPRTPREKGRNYQVQKSSKPDFVSKVEKRPGEYYVNRYMKSFVIIPISYREKMYGNIILCFKQSHNFSKEEKILCTLIGNSMAAAITIRRLISSEQESRALSEAQEARFRALVENSYEIIILIDGGGEIFYASPATAKIFGHKMKDSIGQDIRNLMHQNDFALVGNYLERILQKPNITHTAEFRYQRKESSMGVLESTGVNLLQDPSVKGIVLNIRDVTERRQREKMIEQKKLLKEEKLKAEFIADATHELRTPLAIIKANADLALRARSPSKAHPAYSALEAIGGEVTHLADLLSDLTLLTTKEKAFQRRIIRTNVDLPDLIKRVVRRCQTFTGEKHISLRMMRLPRVFVAGDRSYLEKLFTNIIKNAITYNRDEGSVIVTGRKDLNGVSITIRDTGIGIAKRDLPHIFERFYRGEAARSRHHEGTGLGLAIVKWIAEAHDGSIAVSSILGEGSSFTVTLPLASKTV